MDLYEDVYYWNPPSLFATETALPCEIFSSSLAANDEPKKIDARAFSAANVTGAISGRYLVKVYPKVGV